MQKTLFTEIMKMMILVVGLWMVYVTAESALLNLFQETYFEWFRYHGTLICSLLNIYRMFGMAFSILLFTLLNFKLMLMVPPMTFNSMNHELISRVVCWASAVLPLLDLTYYVLTTEAYCSSYIYQ